MLALHGGLLLSVLDSRTVSSAWRSCPPPQVTAMHASAAQSSQRQLVV